MDPDILRIQLTSSKVITSCNMRWNGWKMIENCDFDLNIFSAPRGGCIRRKTPGPEKLEFLRLLVNLLTIILSPSFLKKRKLSASYFATKTIKWMFIKNMKKEYSGLLYYLALINYLVTIQKSILRSRACAHGIGSSYTIRTIVYLPVMPRGTIPYGIVYR